MRELGALLQGLLDGNKGAWTLILLIAAPGLVALIIKIAHSVWAKQEVIPTVRGEGEAGNDDGDVFVNDRVFGGTSSPLDYRGAAGGYRGADDRVGEVLRDDDDDDGDDHGHDD